LKAATTQLTSQPTTNTRRIAMFRKQNLPRVLHIILVSAFLLAITLLPGGGLAGASGSQGAEEQGSAGAGEHLSTSTPLHRPTSAQTTARTVTYTYDNAGRLVGVDYGGRGITYTYDAAGNLLQREVYGVATPTPTPTATPTETPIPTATPTVTPTPTVMVKVYLPILLRSR